MQAMTPSMQEDFGALPPEEQAKVVGTMDSDFAALPKEEQQKVLQAMSDKSVTTTTTTTREPHPLYRLMTQGIPDSVKSAIAPTVGNIAGQAVGGYLTKNPLGAKAGGVVGSGLGEAANQAMGLTEPSVGRIATTASGAALGEGLVTAGKAAAPFMTPKRGAETLNKLAGPEIENFINQYAPAGKAKQLFAQAEQEGGVIPLGNTLKALDEKIAKMQKASTPPAVLANLQNLKDKILNHQGMFSPTDMQQEMEIMGKTVGKLESQEGSVYGASKDVFKAMWDDLNNIANVVPGPTTLKLARDTFKRQNAINDAIEVSQNASKSLRGQGDVVQFNAPEVIRKLKADEWFSNAFSKQEQTEIFGLLNNLNRIPALRPGAGVQAGSRSTIRALESIAAGGGAGYYAGGTEGAAIGAALGAVVPPASEIIRNIWIASSMKQGRELLKEIIKDRTITSAGASVLGAFVAHQLGEEPQWGSLQGQNMLKIGPEGMTIGPGYINK